ncbi:MAG TPA: flagellin, partial [Thermoguttaceae bacterium]|nr:flagellin [Thermoguttaceae bacterium]
MTRINTNVSSLNAQKSLGRSNMQLQEALTRLSTGLRINSGKDDPAGLIASEVLRSDIISVERAITNSERANQMIATADSSLGQVSGLLNDIRGLVSDAANTGALSSEQIAANQLQIDSSLEAIDRIAQVTAFQGKRLLDGNMDFVTAGVSSSIQDLQVDQANFGTQTEIAISVDVSSQATRGELNYAFGEIADDVVLQIGGSKGFEAFSFAANSSIDDMAAAINLVSDALGVTAEVQTEATAGTIVTSSAGKNNDIVLTATQAGLDEGDIDVKYVKGDSSGTTINYTAKSGSDSAKVVVELETEAWVASSVEQLDDEGLADSGNASYLLTMDPGNSNGVEATMDLVAAAAGSAASGATVTFKDGAAAGSEVASWDAASKTLTVTINDGVSTMAQIETAIDNEGTFAATDNSGGKVVTTAYGQTLATTAVGIGEEDNNALDITAKIDGAQFNGTSVHIVSGNASGTQVGISNDYNQARNNYYGDKLAAGGDDNNFYIEANVDGDYAGANGANLTINFTQSANPLSVTLANDVLTIDGPLATTKASDIVAAINDVSDAAGQAISDQVVAGGGGGDNMGTTWVADNAWQVGRTLGENTNGGGANANGSVTFDGTATTMVVSAVGKIAGAAGKDLSIEIVDTGVGKGNETYNYNANTNVLVIDIDSATTDGADIDAMFAGTGGGASTFTPKTGTTGETIGDYISISSGGGAAVFTLPGAVFAAQTMDEIAATGVAGDVTAFTAAEGDLDVTAGVGYEPISVTYNNDATAAVASVGNSATAMMTLTAATPGTDYNDVAIKFYDSTAVTHPAVPVATFVEADNALYIDIDSGSTTTDMIMTAIGLEGTFTAAADNSDPDNQYVSAAVTVAGAVSIATATELGNTGSSGGDAGTLFMYVEEGKTTAADVISALGQTWNERASSLFTIESSQDNDGSGLLFAAANADALSGGVDGGDVVATGEEVVSAINDDTDVGALLGAALVSGETGVTAVTAFDESVTYGSASAGTGMQFLAPEGARDIEFVSVACEALSVDFTTSPDVTATSTA